MTLTIDLFWSIRSPYSYLATGRLAALTRAYRLDVRVRMVQPIAIRNPAFFDHVNPLMPAYVMRDATRVAEMLGIPYRWPNPDPVTMNMATREISGDQPYIHRLSRLGVAAEESGHGLAFIDSVSRLLWGGAVARWDEGDHLARAVAEAGLDLAALDRAIEADPAKYDASLADNAAALKAAGHWGVPTMVVDGEPFFGQDRIDLLVWRLKRKGLEER